MRRISSGADFQHRTTPSDGFTVRSDMTRQVYHHELLAQTFRRPEMTEFVSGARGEGGDALDRRRSPIHNTNADHPTPDFFSARVLPPFRSLSPFPRCRSEDILLRLLVPALVMVTLTKEQLSELKRPELQKICKVSSHSEDTVGRVTSSSTSRARTES